VCLLVFENWGFKLVLRGDISNKLILWLTLNFFRTQLADLLFESRFSMLE